MGLRLLEAPTSGQECQMTTGVQSIASGLKRRAPQLKPMATALRPGVGTRYTSVGGRFIRIYIYIHLWRETERAREIHEDKYIVYIYTYIHIPKYPYNMASSSRYFGYVAPKVKLSSAGVRKFDTDSVKSNVERTLLFEGRVLKFHAPLIQAVAGRSPKAKPQVDINDPR